VCWTDKPATCRLGRPIWSRYPSRGLFQPRRSHVDAGSASILLAVAGTLPASLFVLDVSEAEILSELSYVKRVATHSRFCWEGEESRKDFLAIVGKHGLGMELHSVHGKYAMAERHDFSVFAFCSDLETARQ
jgi:hypothetical protein